MAGAAEVRAILDRLGLTQARAAELLGVDGRTVRKWATGERTMSEPARRLLLVMEEVPGVRQSLEKQSSVAGRQ